jgi:hypothetical protein
LDIISDHYAAQGTQYQDPGSDLAGHLMLLLPPD